MIDQETLGDRLRKFIEGEELSMSAFARQIDQQPSQISLYIANKVKPGADVLRRFQEKNMSIDWLLDGIGPSHLSDVRKHLPATDEEAQKAMIHEAVSNALLGQIDSQLNPDVRRPLWMMLSGIEQMPTAELKKVIVYAIDRILETDNDAAKDLLEVIGRAINDIAKKL